MNGLKYGTGYSSMEYGVLNIFLLKWNKNVEDLTYEGEKCPL